MSGEIELPICVCVCVCERERERERERAVAFLFSGSCEGVDVGAKCHNELLGPRCTCLEGFSLSDYSAAKFETNCLPWLVRITSVLLTLLP